LTATEVDSSVDKRVWRLNSAARAVDASPVTPPLAVSDIDSMADINDVSANVNWETISVRESNADASALLTIKLILLLKLDSAKRAVDSSVDIRVVSEASAEVIVELRVDTSVVTRRLDAIVVATPESVMLRVASEAKVTILAVTEAAFPKNKVVDIIMYINIIYVTNINIFLNNN